MLTGAIAACSGGEDGGNQGRPTAPTPSRRPTCRPSRSGPGTRTRSWSSTTSTSQHDDVQVCWTNARRRAATSTTKFQTAVTAGNGRTRRGHDRGGPHRRPSRSGGPGRHQRPGLARTSRRTSAMAPGRTSRSATGVYGVPIDGGPMGMIYRKDIFDKYEHHAADHLGRVRGGGAEGARTPAARCSATSRANQPAFVTALPVSRRARTPFAYDPANKGDIGIELNDQRRKKVLDYWGRPGREGPGRHAGPVHTRVHLGRDRRRLRHLPLRRVGPGLPRRVPAWARVPDAGVWATAPLPQWDPTNPVLGELGRLGLLGDQPGEGPGAGRQGGVRRLRRRGRRSRTAGTNQIIFPLNVNALEDPAFVDAQGRSSSAASRPTRRSTSRRRTPTRA